MLDVAATPSQVYTYPTVPVQADRVLAPTPLAFADLDLRLGLSSALTGASVLPTQSPVHVVSAGIPVVGSGQPGPLSMVLTDSRHDLILPQYTMPPPAAPTVAYTQQPWATDVELRPDHVTDERLTAYSGTIVAHRPSQYIPVSTPADSQILGTRPLAVGFAGPVRPYVEPTQTNATHPHAFTTTRSGSNSVVGQSGESLSLFTAAPTPQFPHQLLHSAGQMLPVARDLPASIPNSAALQPSTHALNLTARDGPAIDFTTHIPHCAGNYGPQLGLVPPGCGPNSADRPVTHTSNSLTGNTSTYTHAAPPGAFITRTMQGPTVAFPIGAYPELGSASENMGYSYPGLALPTPVGVRPTISVTNPAPMLEPTGLPIIVPAADNTTSAATGKLATGLEILALAPRPPGVEPYPAGQSLPVPAVNAPVSQSSTAVVSTTAQQAPSTTTVPTVAPAFTPATAATSMAPAASAVTTTTAVTVPTTSTSTVESSSSITGFAVTSSSISNPPVTTTVATTQSVTSPVVVVCKEETLNRYDGSTSPKAFKRHFELVADVNKWTTDAEKLQRLKVALIYSAAESTQGLSEANPKAALVDLWHRLEQHHGPVDPTGDAQRQFYNRFQLES